ncbi:hypothetical protein Ahu01nite_072040 [Winogradskya humida]|uniref:Uncharacterized protein n=1 Tax=Winogradskya humida TaxID=113566 RepID=A0ABQ3ZZS6_9ACTN|nr:hypothetical protein Ahu01nite_072040 [Actinoplanes humidus]
MTMGRMPMAKGAMAPRRFRQLPAAMEAYVRKKIRKAKAPPTELPSRR